MSEQRFSHESTREAGTCYCLGLALILSSFGCLFLSLQEIKDQETVDKVMEALDSDGDAECDFQEFVAFIAMVTAACHEFFEHE